MYLKLITFYNSWDQLIFTYDTNHFEIYIFIYFSMQNYLPF